MSNSSTEAQRPILPESADIPSVPNAENSSEAAPRAPTPELHLPPADDTSVIEEMADPGSLEEEWPERINTHSYEQELKTIFEATQLEDLRVTVQFIEALQSATFDDKYNNMDSKWLHRLRNPPTQIFDIEKHPDLRLALETFLVSTKSSVDTYITMHEAILRRHPSDQIPSYDQIKRRITEITGVTSVVHPMCKNSCLAFTGPFSDLVTCPKCGAPKLCPLTKKAQQEFHTILIGPILQALWREPSSAQKFRYRQTITRTIIGELLANNGMLSSYDDFFYGSDYLEKVKNGDIGENDIVLMLSMDVFLVFRGASAQM